MAENTRRFVLSFLQKENYKLAFNEELLCDEHSGEILIKTREGHIISHGGINRYNHHISNVSNTTNIMGVHGNMYNVTMDDLLMPCEVPILKNILPEPIVIPSDTKQLTLSLDCDCVRWRYNKLSTKLDPDVSVSITYNVTSNDISTENTITILLSDLYKNTITINETDVSDISITGISFLPKTLMGALRIILHSIIAVTS